MKSEEVKITCGVCGSSELAWHHERGKDVPFLACIPCEAKLPPERQALLVPTE